MRAALGDVDPAAYAGEGMSDPDEIALPSDVDNPWLRGQVERTGDYWPGPAPRRRR